MVYPNHNYLSLQTKDDNRNNNEIIPFYSPITVTTHNQDWSTVLFHCITENISSITFHHLYYYIIYLKKIQLSDSFSTYDIST